MEKNSKLNDTFLQQLEIFSRDGSIPAKYAQNLQQFYTGFKDALMAHNLSIDPYQRLFESYLKLVRDQCIEPYTFETYHHRVRHPFDYYQFGIDILKPLIDSANSSTHGLPHAQSIMEALKKGDNVVFFANHQTEADPQAISILLENCYPELAEQLIFVAGHRVSTDPLAVPFSLGRNLLCIYSKRYIDHPPELKLKKQLHNKRTMELMSELLSEGGKAIYVAPSGGRDRPNAEGIVEVDPFDPQSIEMFYLMASRAGHPTHFYPLSLKTFELLPPPQTIQVELGEARLAKRGAIHLSFGPEIDMEHFPGCDIKDKHERRAARASFIWNLVRMNYDTL